MSKFVMKGPGRYRTLGGDIAYVANNLGHPPFIWGGVLLNEYASWTQGGDYSNDRAGSQYDLYKYLGPIYGEEPKPDANKERRERIATAVLSGIYAAQPMPDYADEPVNKIERRDRVEEAILAADALIAELNKE